EDAEGAEKKTEFGASLLLCCFADLPRWAHRVLVVRQAVRGSRLSAQRGPVDRVRGVAAAAEAAGGAAAGGGPDVRVRVPAARAAGGARPGAVPGVRPGARCCGSAAR